MILPEASLDYNSGFRSRHCQGERPAGGQGRAIELLVAQVRRSLREYRVLPLPGQGQGGGVRAQGQALEEQPRPQELRVPPKAGNPADIGILDLIINISCTIGRIIRFFLLKRLQTSRGVSLFLVSEGRSGCLTIFRPISGIKCPIVPFYFL